MQQLLKDSGLPGMKVLEFAFDPHEPSDYLPHRYSENCVCYTGTHDNAPLALWRTEVPRECVDLARKYFAIGRREGLNFGIIRGGMGSVAKLFVAQMQDYLELGRGHRMNTPGKLGENWTWRMLPGENQEALAGRIRELTRLYGRL